MTFIFVSSPYSHKDATVREDRYNAVLKFSADKINEGFVIYSPIVHCHPIALAYQLPLEFEFWERFDKAMIDGCSELWVLALDGWETSNGMAMEIQHARNIGKPIEFHYVD